MTDDEKELLFHVGVAVLVVQSTEAILKFALQYCWPGYEEITLESLEREKEELRRKTLGQFLVILRKRVDLDDQFEAVLGTFLTCRNTLVHRLEDIPGWNLQTPEGQKAGHEFVAELIHSGMFITRVFAGLIRAWAKQIGIDPPLPKEIEAALVEIDAKYPPAATSIFFKKSVA